jgi:hypothetical protein
MRAIPNTQVVFLQSLKPRATHTSVSNYAQAALSSRPRRWRTNVAESGLTLVELPGSTAQGSSRRIRFSIEDYSCSTVS